VNIGQAYKGQTLWLIWFIIWNNLANNDIAYGSEASFKYFPLEKAPALLVNIDHLERLTRDKHSGLLGSLFGIIWPIMP
jgi:hypothetical protein